MPTQRSKTQHALDPFTAKGPGAPRADSSRGHFCSKESHKPYALLESRKFSLSLHAAFCFHPVLQPTSTCPHKTPLTQGGKSSHRPAPDRPLQGCRC